MVPSVSIKAVHRADWLFFSFKHNCNYVLIPGTNITYIFICWKVDLDLVYDFQREIAWLCYQVCKLPLTSTKVMQQSIMRRGNYRQPSHFTPIPFHPMLHEENTHLAVRDELLEQKAWRWKGAECLSYLWNRWGPSHSASCKIEPKGIIRSRFQEK